MTNKNKHTPGPWHWVGKSTRPCNEGSPNGHCSGWPIHCKTCPNSKWKSPDGKRISTAGAIRLMAEDGYRIVSVASTPFRDEDKANARLIAAAPELLAALERVLECHRLKISLDTNAGAVEQARAAIAKARGN